MEDLVKIFSSILNNEGVSLGFSIIFLTLGTLGVMTVWKQLNKVWIPNVGKYVKDYMDKFQKTLDKFADNDAKHIVAVRECTEVIKTFQSSTKEELKDIHKEISETHEEVHEINLQLEQLNK